MTPSERWLAATWEVVRRPLPPPPATVIEVGCGPLGGFVPRLRSEGYDAIGIDPTAPDEPSYQRIEVESAELPHEIDVVVASTSLHHVADPAKVLDRITRALRSSGVVIVVEWAWENFDEHTAGWCFERLASDEDGWLHRRRDEWLASGQDWPAYLRAWAEEEGVHRGEELVGLLDDRLECQALSRGPYFFADLAGTTEADEQDAIDGGQIRATRIDYVGTRR